MASFSIAVMRPGYLSTASFITSGAQLSSPTEIIGFSQVLRFDAGQMRHHFPEYAEKQAGFAGHLNQNPMLHTDLNKEFIQ